MIRVYDDEPTFADLFLKFLLAHSMRTQADLVDQLIQFGEKRLARILLLIGKFGKPGEPETFIPPITQETLADMIGTTRSRVSFFMNRFRKLGFISYNGRIQVHKSLLNVVFSINCPTIMRRNRPSFPISRSPLNPGANEYHGASSISLLTGSCRELRLLFKMKMNCHPDFTTTMNVYGGIVTDEMSTAGRKEAEHPFQSNGTRADRNSS